MAPPTKFPPVEAQLVELLRACQRDGLPFEDAWREVVHPARRLILTTDANPPPRALRWPSDREARAVAREAIYGAREGIRRAYERRAATRAEFALVRLRPVLGVLTDASVTPARVLPTPSAVSRRAA